jgi:hypothetical protein
MNPSDILYAITVACKPQTLVETRAGYVTYADWCASEKRRIEAKSDWPVAIFTNPKTKEISLVLLKSAKKA